MVRAWYMDDSLENYRLEHHRTPPQFVTLQRLAEDTGVLYWKLDIKKYESDGSLDKIRSDRGYTYTDVVHIHPDKLPNYEEKLKNFYEEHIHLDEEIRFIIEGAGYFDVRDSADEWIRIEVTPGDLLVLPAGIYHRFTPLPENHVKAMRLFVGEPVWTPYNRPADDMDARKEYICQQKNNFKKA